MQHTCSRLQGEKLMNKSVGDKIRNISLKAKRKKIATHDSGAYDRRKLIVIEKSSFNIGVYIHILG